jgi:hypothetical protein
MARMANRRRCPEFPEHALVDIRDHDSGDAVTIRIPWESRFDPVTWDDDELVEWDGPAGPVRGVELGRGERGITAAGHDGTVYKLDHGKYRNPKPVRLVRPLEMAMELKAGERWITVHPNGDDSKGVPILISPNPDGTHSVIAGAGGALQHLKLKGVKSTEEHKADAKKSAQERAAAEKERKANQTPEQREKEKGAKSEIRDAKMKAEREFIEHAKKTVGGISEDVDESNWGGLSDDAKNRLRKAHHRVQLKEAKQRVRETMAAEVKAGVTWARETAQLHQDLDGDHFVDQGTRSLIEQELELQTEDEEERRAERLKPRGHQPAVRGEAARVAAEQALPEIKNADLDMEKFVKLGGHKLDAEKPAAVPAVPSEAQWRDATQLMVDAKVLAEAAEGNAPTDDLSKAVLEKAARDIGLKETESEEAKERLLREAARRHRRGELGLAKADKFKALEGEGDDGFERAQRSYEYGARMQRITEEVKDARRQGLMDTTQTPASEPELAAYDELIRHQAQLRQATKDFHELTKRVEDGDYGAAREAFELKHEPADASAVSQVDDEIRAELARGIRGMADRKRPEFMAAHSSGAHDALTDAGLSIGGQAYVDRLVVDALGPKHASVITRWAMERDGHDAKNIQTALEANQGKEANEAAAAAMQRAESFVPGFAQTVHDVGDLETAMTTLHARDSDMGVAQRAVGAALGRLETLATLGQTMREPMPQALSVPFEGDGGLERTMTYLHSVGLVQQGRDYQVNRTTGQVSIPQSSWHKLVQRTDSEQIAKRKTVEAIKRGEHDEKGWMPKGFVSRPESTFNTHVPTQPRYFQPLDVNAGPLSDSVRNHLGSRLLDGEHPADIQSDMLSPAAMQRIPANRKTEYTNAVREAFPLTNEQGEKRKFEEFAPHFQDIAEKYGREKYGEGVGLQAQSLNLEDPKVQEAIYRTLGEHPETKHAFIPTGAMSDQDRRVMRRYLHQRLGIDPKQHTPEARMAQDMAALGEKPKAAQGGLFGGPSAEASEWSANRDKVLAKYPTASHEHAIEAMNGSGDKGRYLENHLKNVFGPLPEDAKLPTDDAARAQLLRDLASPSTRDGALEGLFSDPRQRAKAGALLRDQGRTPWQKFVGVHGSQELAYSALQDELRGRFAESFVKHHGQVTGKPVQKGIQEVTNMERHLRATDPEKADEHLAKLREQYSKVQERATGGQFQEQGGQGSLLAAHGRFMEQETIASQNQLGMFGSGPKAKDTGAPELRSTLQPGERWTLGKSIEQQIASVAPHLGAPFEAGKPVTMFPGANMDGARIDQQRVIKSIAEVGRMGVFMGTGAGKTPMSIGAFTHLHSEGKAQHAVYAVPSAVQDQFGAEMTVFTEPGKYKFQTGAGKTHDERVAMLKDTGTHMKVLTHESFRDTALKLMADHHRGGDVEKMIGDMRKVDANTRASWMRQAFDANGIPPYFFAGDEAHRFTSGESEGSQSVMHLVMSAASHPVNTTHAMFGTATPAKNNAEEAWSMAAMIDPDKYGDRDAFMRNYGTDFAMNPQSVQRETAPMTYIGKIPPQGVQRIETDNPIIGPDGKKQAQGAIDVHPEHQKKIDAVQALYQRAIDARERGQVDVEAMKGLSPHSFEGLEGEHAEARARELQESAGIVRETAMRKAIQLEPIETNNKLRRMVEVVEHDLKHGTWTDKKGQTRQGKPSIIFSNSAEECRLIHETLQARGVRAALYHGGLDSKQRAEVMRGFNPKGGQEAKHDVLVVTPAGEAGLNAQRGKAQHHYDIPFTEKAWNQRSGRAYRQGQEADVDNHNWYSKTDYEANGLRRLKEKTLLADVWQNPVERLEEKGIAGAYQRALAERHQDADVGEQVA